MNATNRLLNGSAEPNPLRQEVLSLSEVGALIDADKTLGARRQRDIRSALSAISKVLGRPLERIPSQWRILHKTLGSIHYAQCGFSQKRWQNIISEVRFAIRYTNAEPSPIPNKPLSIAWKKIRGLLKIKGMQRGLSRFIRFCDASGIPPHQVNDTVSNQYLLHLEEFSIGKKPHVTHRMACAMWNKAVATVAGWPGNPITVPNYRQPSWALKPEQFSEGFQEDVDAYLKWLSGNNFATDRPPADPCKPSTIALQRRQCYRVASAAVLNGWDIQNLNGLDDLVSQKVVQRFVEHYTKENSEYPGKYVRDLVRFLRTTARRWVQVDEEHQQWFADILRRWKDDPTGMTEKNRRTLRQFHSPKNIARILQLPQRLMDRARRSKAAPKRIAVIVQKALAIELLLMAPMRIGNLAALRLDQHIIRPSGPSGRVLLVLEGFEVKNDMAMEFELPEHTCELLDTYLNDHRIHLAPEDSPWLFPGGNGTHKRAQTLSEQLSEITKRETGVRLTAHQFRHLAAKLFLDQEPGNYELVRRLLGHKSMRTTTHFYTGMETLAATRQYDSMIIKLREING